MREEVRVAKGAAALYLASISQLLLNTAYFVVLTNVLSADEVGIVSLLNIFIIAIATISTTALPIPGSGTGATPPAVTRFVSQYLQEGQPSKSRKIFFLSLLLCSASSGLLSIILIYNPAAFGISLSSNKAVILPAAVDGVVYSFAQLAAYSLIGVGKATISGVMIIMSGFVRYLLASLLLIAGFGIYGVYYGFALGDFVLASVGILIVAKDVRSAGSGAIDKALVSTYTLSVIASSLIGFSVGQVDKLIAFFQKGFVNLAVYNVATVGAAIAAFAPAALTNVLVPSLSFLKDRQVSERRELMRDYTRYVTIIASPMGFGIAAVSPFLLRLFGEDYVSGSPLLTIISISVSLTAISSVYSSNILAGKKTHLFSVGNAIALAALIVIAVPLIPVIGLEGAALGRAGMLVASLVVFGFIVKKTGDLVLDLGAYLKANLASSGMGVLLYVVLRSIEGAFFISRTSAVILSLFLLLMGSFIYGVEMKLLKAFTPEDLEFLEKILPGRVRVLARFAKIFL